ncbi:MAG: hypothetical protein IKP40_10965 [Clostridia bacterium]|nr:hypothetical protein [Clostridia bacterium]
MEAGDIRDALPEIIEEALDDYFSSRTFTLPDGTALAIAAKERLKVLSPDRKKQLCCEGGLKVDGKTLIVQTGPGCWEPLCCFSGEEEAVSALSRIREAMKNGEAYLEL